MSGWSFSPPDSPRHDECKIEGSWHLLTLTRFQCNIRISITKRKNDAAIPTRRARTARGATIHSRCIPKLAQISGWPFLPLSIGSLALAPRRVRYEIWNYSTPSVISTRKIMRSQMDGYCNRIATSKGERSCIRRTLRLWWLDLRAWLEPIGCSDSSSERINMAIT